MKSPLLLPKKREFFKLGLLALLLGATSFTLIKVWTGSGPAQPQNSVSLPERFALQDWTFIRSQALPIPQNEAVGRLTSVLGSGRLYHYQQQQLPLTVELWLIDNTNGDIPAFIDAYAQQRIATGRQQAIVRYRAGIGYYGVIQAADRTVLSSCMNTTGEATFNISQFSQARLQRDLSLARIAKWIFGQDTLLRKQCLWSHLSIASAHQNLNLDSILEKTWFNLQEGADSILLKLR